MLVATYFLTADLPANDREANALLRLLGQYREEMRRDYVTGVYNRAFLDSTYRKKWRLLPAQASRSAWLLPA